MKSTMVYGTIHRLLRLGDGPKHLSHELVCRWGNICTKLYIIGSSYVFKMSHYKKGEWQATWDELCWRFMHHNRSFFLCNPKLGMLIGTYDKMATEKQELHLYNAQQFIDNLVKQLS